jgi:hypothetical protein
MAGVLQLLQVSPRTTSPSAEVSKNDTYFVANCYIECRELKANALRPGFLQLVFRLAADLYT